MKASSITNRSHPIDQEVTPPIIPVHGSRLFITGATTQVEPVKPVKRYRLKLQLSFHPSTEAFPLS